MKVVFSHNFLKTLKRLKDDRLKSEILSVIDGLEAAQTIKDIPNLKKLKGFSVYFRIRIGDYRMGIKIEQDIIHVAAFEHRKDIYKQFP